MTYVKKKQPKATIQLDKLVFSCKSVIEDNFDYAIEHDSKCIFETEFDFNDTRLVRTIDPSAKFKHSYIVLHNKKEVGRLDFKIFGNHFYDLIRFTVLNEVFYTNTLQYIPNVLHDLNLEINNFTKIDVAVDCYNYNIEHIIRKNIRAKDNTIKLLGKLVKDRDQTLEQITYYHKGSQNNIYKFRSLLIQNNKKTFELSCYDKTEEIKQSGKEYINNYHRLQKPKFNNLYRIEFRLTTDEISRYIKKHKKTISFNDVMNPEFLHSVFNEYLDRIIVAYKNGQSRRKREKISLVPFITFVPSEGILQPTLAVPIIEHQQIDIEQDRTIIYNKMRNNIINKYIKDNNELNYIDNIFINKEMIYNNQFEIV